MAAISTITAKIGMFDYTQEDWLTYTKRLQHFFTANGVKEDKQAVTLLSMCGVSAYRLIKSLLAPVKPETRIFAQLVELVAKHHNPEPTVIVQRFKFHSRCCQPGETVSTYAAELRCLSEYCKFGDQLQDMLRDRLICGVGYSADYWEKLSSPTRKLLN